MKKSATFLSHQVSSSAYRIRDFQKSFFGLGLVSGTVSAGAGTFTFTHPLNPTRAENLTSTYRWSNDLSTLTADGVTNNGSIVNFAQGTTSVGLITVTATVTETPLDNLFIDVQVTQNQLQSFTASPIS